MIEIESDRAGKIRYDFDLSDLHSEPSEHSTEYGAGKTVNKSFENQYQNALSEGSAGSAENG